MAEKAKNALIKKYPNYDIRLRSLPKEINAKIGYRIDFNQIRFDKKEVRLANEIRNTLIKESIFPLEVPVLKPVNQKKLPNKYISVFVRNL